MGLPFAGFHRVPRKLGHPCSVGMGTLVGQGGLTDALAGVLTVMLAGGWADGLVAGLAAGLASVMARFISMTNSLILGCLRTLSSLAPLLLLQARIGFGFGVH